MKVELIRVNIQDAENLWKMQIVAFQDLYAKYQDPETSPATETLEKTMTRLEQPYTYYYYIKVGDCIVGAMRVIDHKEDGKYKFLSPIFIMKEFRGRGYAQQAIRLAVKIHGSYGWELDTILQEKGNCYLYEKMGYKLTGEAKAVNGRMTLVFYRKD
ncbi:MAG: GNAT family N-acetyltransferase [Paludibacteraceae bacterium]|nr:GNAT family N-acetyltransferase [Paludibacteraceae bacterium]